MQAVDTVVEVEEDEVRRSITASSNSFINLVWQQRRSFASRDDFRMSSDGHSLQRHNSEDWYTPQKAPRSHGTSSGNPQHAQAKNNAAATVALNDSISSNHTRPSQDMKVGRDVPPTAMRDAEPGLSLADNREVSPSPVAGFNPRSLSNNLGHNRVTVPFNRASSFKISGVGGG